MRVKVNGVELFYEKTGSGPPLLLLHGNSEDHHIFDKIAEKLAPTYTLYALDSREHGESEKSGVFSYDVMAEDVYGFITALGLGKVNLVGFSDGAILGLLLGLRRPGVLRKMALLGPNLSPEDLTEEAVAFVKSLAAESENPLLELIFREPHIELKSLGAITIPCLVVAGENDLFKPEVMPGIAQALPKAELKILAGHDHMSYIVDNDLLAPDLIRFFGSGSVKS
ncbi:MAG: alpha/beta hydrolase [Deltaproteobacteria bacterium]|jgi:pimeloyl-ACP methyl ester carboxylesterase|nr:alpha/beta hydrolase [Deltaproteobacteria bacterium]